MHFFFFFFFFIAQFRCDTGLPLSQLGIHQDEEIQVFMRVEVIVGSLRVDSDTIAK